MNDYFKIPILYGTIVLFLLVLGSSCDDFNKSLLDISKSQGNKPPTIESVILSKTKLNILDDFEITVIAKDPEGDTELVYTFAAYETDENFVRIKAGERDPENPDSYYFIGSFSGVDEDGNPVDDKTGIFKTKQGNIRYSAPSDRAAYVAIYVKVEDSANAASQSVKELTITNQPPEIEVFILTSKNAFLGEDVALYVKASDADKNDLFFEIKADKPGIFINQDDDNSVIDGMEAMADAGNNIIFRDFTTWGETTFSLDVYDKKGGHTSARLKRIILPPMGEDVSHDVDSILPDDPNCLSKLEFSSVNQGWFMGVYGSLLRYFNDIEEGTEGWNYIKVPYNDYMPLKAVCDTSLDTAWLISDRQVFFYKSYDNADPTAYSIFTIPSPPPKYNLENNGLYVNSEYYTDIYMEEQSDGSYSGWLATTFGLFEYTVTNPDAQINSMELTNSGNVIDTTYETSFSHTDYWKEAEVTSNNFHAYSEIRIDTPNELEFHHLDMDSAISGFVLAKTHHFNEPIITESSAEVQQEISIFKLSGTQWQDQQDITSSIATFPASCNKIYRSTPTTGILVNTEYRTGAKGDFYRWDLNQWPPVEAGVTEFTKQTFGSISFAGASGIFGGYQIDPNFYTKSSVIFRYNASNSLWEDVSYPNLTGVVRDVDLTGFSEYFFVTEHRRFFTYSGIGTDWDEMVTDFGDMQFTPLLLEMLTPYEGWCVGTLSIGSGLYRYIFIKYDGQKWQEYY